MRILLLGYSPFPFDPQKKNLGPGKRTWQFAQPLTAAGHEVLLLCGRYPHSFFHEDSLPPVSTRPQIVPGLTIREAAYDLFQNPAWLAGEAAGFKPEIVVGATVAASALGARMGLKVPLFADIFGDTMAEAQAKSQVYGDDGYLHLFWDILRPALLAGSGFSAVSRRQGYALLGQLGVMGRLTGETLGYEWVRVIPCGLDPAQLPGNEAAEGGDPLDSLHLPEGAFVVLWSGGMNTWTGAETLLEAFEAARRKENRLHLVITGGALEGHDEVTYRGFVQRLAASEAREAVHALGWVEAGEAGRILRQCDAALNVDKPSAEAILGSRNRIVEWMFAGVPVVTTLATELSEDVEKEGLGWTYPAGDGEALAGLLAGLPGRREELAVRAGRAKAYAGAHYTLEASAKPLLDWVKLVEAGGLPKGVGRGVDLAAGLSGGAKAVHLLGRLRWKLEFEGWGKTIRKGLYRLFPRWF